MGCYSYAKSTLYFIFRYRVSIEKKTAYDMTTLRFNSVYKPITTTTLPLDIFQGQEPPSYAHNGGEHASRTLPDVPNMF